jgi:RNA polymerase sigma-70 factor, ECF subfamily
MKFASSPAASDRATHLATTRARALHDARLVERFKAGDDTAFTEIVTRHRPQLFQVAFGVLHNRPDAEEIVQDTFLRAHRALPLFRGESSLASWLYRIAINLARNRYWYFFRRRRHLTGSLEQPVSVEANTTGADFIASDAPDPAAAAATGEFTGLVEECMVRLTGLQREVLTLRNDQDRSYRDIARVLGINLGTVKSRVARARQQLRAFMVEAYSSGVRGKAGAPVSWFETIRSSGRFALTAA